MATKGAKVSPRLSVLEAGKYFYSQYPFDLFVNEILPTAQREPIYSSNIVKAIGDSLQEAIYTEKAIDQILTDAENKCNSLLK